MKCLIIVLITTFVWSCSSGLPPKNKEKRTLYLIRHAKSSHKDNSLADIDRPLNNRGETDAVLMGKELSKKGILYDKVLVSTSERTKLTAKYLLSEMDFDASAIEYDRKLYRTSAENVVSILQNLETEYKSVAIIGHNPTTYQVANYFQKDTLFKDIPTCAVIAIEFEADSWGNVEAKKGKFLFFDYPKKYK